MERWRTPDGCILRSSSAVLLAIPIVACVFAAPEARPPPRASERLEPAQGDEESVHSSPANVQIERALATFRARRLSLECHRVSPWPPTSGRGSYDFPEIETGSHIDRAFSFEAQFLEWLQGHHDALTGCMNASLEPRVAVFLALPDDTNGFLIEAGGGSASGGRDVGGRDVATERSGGGSPGPRVGAARCILDVLRTLSVYPSAGWFTAVEVTREGRVGWPCFLPRSEER